MILNFQRALSILIVLFLIGCSKEIDIIEFSDDFNHYEPELRIEALILPSDNTAIVRIDRSALITDPDLYNCMDDDGDWNAEFDDLGEDGMEGDPTDEDGDCDFGADEDDPCFTELSVGEGNGIPDCGEPHVDETDEIITSLHIDDCTVKMISENATCNFIYDESAGSFWFFPYKEGFFWNN